MIKSAEQRVVTSRWPVLAGGRDPDLQEAEELIHPLRGRRRQLRRRIVADVTGGVELIHRADQPHPERGLDLDRLAGLQEPVEPLKDRQTRREADIPGTSPDCSTRTCASPG